jgi:large subunit ribosomal protein L34
LFFFGDKLLIISEFDIQRIFWYAILSLNLRFNIMSVTYQPKKKKRARTHGFLKRMSSKGGKKVVSRRRQKGRKKLTP